LESRFHNRNFFKTGYPYSVTSLNSSRFPANFFERKSDSFLSSFESLSKISGHLPFENKKIKRAFWRIGKIHALFGKPGKYRRSSAVSIVPIRE